MTRLFINEAHRPECEFSKCFALRQSKIEGFAAVATTDDCGNSRWTARQGVQV